MKKSKDLLYKLDQSKRSISNFGLFRQIDVIVTVDIHLIKRFTYSIITIL